jgi:hypothetical protein
MLNLPAGDVDPLVLTIKDSNFTQIESRGDFAAVIQTGLPRVYLCYFFIFIYFLIYLCLLICVQSGLSLDGSEHGDR